MAGGYVGLELAQAYPRFGSRVTAIDHGVRLLRREDADVSQAVKAILEADGIEVLLPADVKQVRGRSGEVMAVVQATCSDTALRDAILADPTMAEGLNTLSGSLPFTGA